MISTYTTGFSVGEKKNGPNSSDFYNKFQLRSQEYRSKEIFFKKIILVCVNIWGFFFPG
jgi:hypothetical protein